MHRLKFSSEPSASAQAVGLRYVSDAVPGIHRAQGKKGFRYFEASKKLVRDKATLARIKALSIPPAWAQVWICPFASGHLQATGRDDRGRKQYRYHPRWREVRDQTKYLQMTAFGRALPGDRAIVCGKEQHHRLAAGPAQFVQSPLMVEKGKVEHFTG